MSKNDKDSKITTKKEETEETKLKWRWPACGELVTVTLGVIVGIFLFHLIYRIYLTELHPYLEPPPVQYITFYEWTDGIDQPWNLSCDPTRVSNTDSLQTLLKSSFCLLRKAI